MEYKDVVIVAAKRTAVGRFGGSLKDLSAVEIGSQLVQGILDSLAIPKEEYDCLLYTSPSPRDRTRSRMPSSA